MNSVLAWLEAHDRLAGWAQFAAATVTLVIAYLTANLPIWAQRKADHVRVRGLDVAAVRLLEAARSDVEFLAERARDEMTSTALTRGSIRLRGALSAIERFPSHELRDRPGETSLATRLSLMSSLLQSLIFHSDRLEASLHGPERVETLKLLEDEYPETMAEWAGLAAATAGGEVEHTNPDAADHA